MKKKALSILLAICLTATMVTACGTKEAEAPQETVEAANEEEPEEEAPAEPTFETVTYDVSVTSVDEESGKATAYDANGQEYILTAADTLSEDEKALLTAGANVKVSTEVEVAEDAAEETTEAEATEETEATEEVGDPGEDEVAEEETTEETNIQGEADEQENIAPIEITVTAVEALGETEGYELNQKVQELTLGYSMEDMADTQMYAKSSVNVRKSPSADDEKLGSLSTAQEVTVTGLTSTNWYRINYNDGTAYVSANYLQNEKPVVQTAKKSSGGSASSGSASSGSSSAAQPTTADLYQVYSEAELDAAYASGDMALYNQMLTANTDAYDAKWGTHWGSASAEAPTTSGGGSSSGGSSAGSSSSEKSTSADFVDYLNQKRSEEGKGTLTWDDSLASLAAQRAEEIVDNFSHETSLSVGAEIIQKNPSGSVSSWFDNFYNSTGHRMNMMSDNKRTVGAAYCKCGSYYYIVVLFGY